QGRWPWPRESSSANRARSPGSSSSESAAGRTPAIPDGGGVVGDAYESAALLEPGLLRWPLSPPPPLLVAALPDVRLRVCQASFAHHLVNGQQFLFSESL